MTWAEIECSSPTVPDGGRDGGGWDILSGLTWLCEGWEVGDECGGERLFGELSLVWFLLEYGLAVMD